MRTEAVRDSLNELLERTSEEVLARQFGLRFSAHAALLTGLTSEEQTQIQREPLLMCPDRSWRDRIVPKVEHNESWVIVQRPECDLELYLTDSSKFGCPSSPYRALWQTQEHAERAYRHTAWTLTELPTGFSRILNIGCATGHEAVLIRELDAAREVVSLDLLEENAGAARAVKRLAVAGSAATLPFRNAAFDGVYSNNVLEHCFEVDQALRELHRVLTPSGVAICVLPTEASMTNPFAGDLLQPAKRWCPRRIDAGHPFKSDLYDLDWRFRDAGFRRVAFVYDALDLSARMAFVRARLESPSWWRIVIERVLFRIQSSSSAFAIEHGIRSRMRFWRFRNYPLWLAQRLGLADKIRETLEVACIAYK